MPDLVIRRISPEIHRRLKERAGRNRRSMNMEVLELLEHALRGDETRPTEPPQPFAGKFAIDDAWIRRAREEGRP